MPEADYLKLEESAREKHEYVAGLTFAMTGATVAHNLLVMNLARHLYDPISKSGCHLFASDMKVKIAALHSYYYPDLVATCEAVAPAAVFLTAPSMIIEVLSPSTRLIDQREKLQAYCSIPTLTEYALVHQDKQRVDFCKKDERGNWQCSEFTEDTVVLFSFLPGAVIQLKMEDIYLGLDFSRC
jgi:Uma2 family endonuclease